MKQTETKTSLKKEAEKLRRQEIVTEYKAFQEAKEELIEAKSRMKKAGREYVQITCGAKDKDEVQKAKLTFEVAQKEYNDAMKNVESIYNHLRELESLKQESKVDRNVLIKCVTFAGVTFLTELIELPGNLVNLRAVKVVKPITDLLRL